MPSLSNSPFEETPGAGNAAPASTPEACPRVAIGRQLKYRRIVAEVRKLAETLPLDAKMPTERDLAVTHGCSVLTIRKGLQVLVDEGVIRRRMGSGTFVAKRPEMPARTERMLGILTYWQSDAYAYRLLQSVAHAALGRSLPTRSVWIRGFGEDALEQLAALRREGCTAFTLPWFPLELEREVQDFVRRSGVGISLPQTVPGFEHYCFVAPHLFGRSMVEAIGQLCRYFAALGGEAIALLGPDTTHNAILQRQLVAYASEMSHQQRPMFSHLVGPHARDMDALARRWAEHRGRLAVISYDDEHALRLMTAMHKLGMKAPDDFRIVGYNNTEGSRFSDPPLSTVAQNFDASAEGLIRSALALAEGRIEQANELPGCTLVVRGTCGGAGRIDETLRAAVPGMRLVEEGGEKPIA